MRLFLRVLLLTVPLFAQVQSMRTRFGDDLRWADPNYDDSAWNNEEDPVASRIWNRFRVRVPDDVHQPVIGLLGAVMEVYAEGRKIGARGGFPPAFADASRAYATFPLPADLAQPGRMITVAVRRWDPPGSRVRGFAQPREIRIHSAAESFSYDYHSNMQVRKRGAMATFLIMAGALLLLVLAHQGLQRNREFLLAVGFCVAFLAWSLTLILVSSVAGVGLLNIPNGLLLLLTNLLGIELLAQLAGVTPDFWMRGGQAVFIAVRVPLILGGLYSDAPAWLRPVADLYTASTYVIFAAALWIVVRRRLDGRTIGLPLVVLAAAFAVGAVGIQGASVRGTRQVAFLDLSVPLPTAGFVAFGVTLCGMMLARFRAAGFTAAQLNGQMDAARQVQQMLLERGSAPAQDYRIEPVYLPAENVGGDFFRIVAAPDGGTLVVVGDVSGKGLRAAMVVSVVIGALLNRRSSRPGEVLTELNRAITGQLDGGFVTCLAVLLEPGGRIVAANAGHVRPYACGREVEVPDGLPLGIVAEAAYEEAEWRLDESAAAQWTLLSDGVVEATSSTGELFGFDRTREISGQSAAQIAEAAQAWGQNDDITVVTVRRMNG